MKPWNTLARAATRDGEELVLQERAGVYVIRVAGQELMSSARHGSEEAMAQAGLEGLAAAAPEVLIGGLGLGYTLRATLDRLPASGRVVVVEIAQPIVDWNRGPLARLAGAPLEDPRVALEVADLARFLEATRRRFDAILVDVDNGPAALSVDSNARLYRPAGLAAFRAALKPRGALVVWSAGPDPRFLAQLHRAGFDAEERRVGAHRTGGARHTLFVARRRSS